MIFDHRLIDEIEDDELDSLVASHVHEDMHLEFKETYLIREPEDVLEVLKDISSLANTGGE